MMPILSELIARLPPPHRIIMQMRYIDDLGDREISRILGMPLRDVRMSLARALDALRPTLGAATPTASALPIDEPYD